MSCVRVVLEVTTERVCRRAVASCIVYNSCATCELRTHLSAVFLTFMCWFRFRFCLFLCAFLFSLTLAVFVFRDFVVLRFVSYSTIGHRLAGSEVSKMTNFVSSWM